MAAAAATGGLVGWAERSARRRVCTAACDRQPGWLRFVFYGRVSTEDWQDPVMSRARQREQAGAVVRGHGVIVAEFLRHRADPETGVGVPPAVRRPGRRAGRPGPGMGRGRDRGVRAGVLR